MEQNALSQSQLMYKPELASDFTDAPFRLWSPRWETTSPLLSTMVSQLVCSVRLTLPSAVPWIDARQDGKGDIKTLILNGA